MKTLNEIQVALQSVGNITETARLKNKSLTGTEIAFIANVRQKARQHFSQQMINTLEEEGAVIVRKAARS